MSFVKVGILGSGDVAKALGHGLATHGWEVMLGSRNPAGLADWVEKTGKGVQAGSFTDAAAFGEVLVLAVKGSAAKVVLELGGEKNLVGKTVIDACNPIAEAGPVNGVLSYFTTLDNSLMEQLQGLVPGANFVKAFSCVGSSLMVNPSLNGQVPTMFICGNSELAKEQVREILVAFGWDIADMGGVEAARAIEPLAMLWCIPGFKNNSWTHAFKLLTL